MILFAFKFHIEDMQTMSQLLTIFNTDFNYIP